jgi:hypothetical protein
LQVLKQLDEVSGRTLEEYLPATDAGNGLIAEATDGKDSTRNETEKSPKTNRLSLCGT